MHRVPPRLAEFADLGPRSARVAAVRPDLFHAPNPFAVALTRRPRVVSILDTIPLDLPGHRKTGLKNRVFFQSASRASAILTLSEFSRTRIIDLFEIPPERVVVAPLAVDFALRDATPVAGGVDGVFALCLIDMRTPDPRKRASWLPVLASRLASYGISLVVAGAGSEGAAELDSNITALGRISDERLAALYRECVCFCYFSAYEGQGLPPLEAMAAGAPVIAMANTAVTEVVGEGGKLISEPVTHWEASVEASAEEPIEEMASLVAEIAGSPELRSTLSEAALKQASRYSWERFVSGVKQAYDLALEVR